MPRSCAISATLPHGAGGATGLAAAARISLRGSFDGPLQGFLAAVEREAANAAKAASAILRRPHRRKREVTHPEASQPLESRSDEELFTRHREGDAGALRVLMERYAGELHGFLTRLVGSRAGADDVFQEAFLQIHLSADAFDPERRFKPWLYTIAANKGRDYLRRQRRRSAVSLDAPVGVGSDAGLVDLLPSVGDRPAAPLEDADERSAVKLVVDELPAHYREILLLAYFQRMSYSQIADSLGIPLGTVKSRLHAAVACFAQGWRVACERRGQPLPPKARPDHDA